MDDLSEFGIAQNADQAPPPYPKKLALVVFYDLKYEDVEEDMMALKDRYEAEGYGVETLCINEDLIKNENGKYPELEDKINWIKASAEALLSFYHHGSPDHVRPEHHKGSTTASMLSSHGLDEGNLNKMRIRYGPCFGAQKEGNAFFDTLHKNGAGNFIGDAKNTLNSILHFDAPQLTPQESNEKIKTLESQLEYFASDAGIQQISPDDFLKLEAALTSYYKFGEVGTQRPLKRGDSFSIFTSQSDNPLKEYEVSFPRETDPETGHYLYNPHYLAPIKTENSQVVKTSDPEVIAAFKNNNLEGNTKAARSPRTERKPRGGCAIK